MHYLNGSGISNDHRRSKWSTSIKNGRPNVSSVLEALGSPYCVVIVLDMNIVRGRSGALVGNKLYGLDDKDFNEMGGYFRSWKDMECKRIKKASSRIASGEGDGVSNWISSGVIGYMGREFLSLMYFLELEVVEKLLEEEMLVGSSNHLVKVMLMRLMIWALEIEALVDVMDVDNGDGVSNDREDFGHHHHHRVDEMTCLDDEGMKKRWIGTCLATDSLRGTFPWTCRLKDEIERDGLAFNGKVYHDTFQFKKLTKWVGQEYEDQCNMVLRFLENTQEMQRRSFHCKKRLGQFVWNFEDLIQN
ncbi:hypothetical protein Tco_0099258 [Tanacetum coccineum]